MISITDDRMSWVLSSVQQYRWQCRLCLMHSVNVGYNDYMSHWDSAINDTGDRVLPVTQWQLNSTAYYLPDATYYDRASRWHGTSVAMLHSRMFFLMCTFQWGFRDSGNGLYLPLLLLLFKSTASTTWLHGSISTVDYGKMHINGTSEKFMH